MSEKVCALLLRLYPAEFREAYGDEAIQLIHDRARDEQGMWAKLRLWIDLAADLATVLPRAHRRAAPVRATVSPQSIGVAPRFHVLQPATPRLSAVAYGGILSAVAFGALFLWFGYSRNYRELHTWQGPTKHDLIALSFSGRHSNVRRESEMPLAAVANPERKIEVSGRPAHTLLSSWQGGSEPSGFHAMGLLPGGPQSSVEPQSAQPNVQAATAAMIEASSSHDVVMLGEVHGDKQEYQWLNQLVMNREFSRRVDDIVVEFGNSLYQKSVDRYIGGQEVPIEQVEKAWRNMIGAVGPPSPLYGEFYAAVRAANMKNRGKHQMRIVLGDPYGDWEKIKDAEDLGPYLAHRDEWYAQVVKDEVLAKKHHALLIMGSGHFLRRNGPALVESTIRAAGADPYLIVMGTNAVGGYDNLDQRFDSWPIPAIIALAGNWVGDLPAMPVVSGGTAPATPLKLSAAADALLYVGSRDSLVEVRMPGAELDGTPYGNEIARRLAIQMGHPAHLVFGQTEVPQFPRPQPPPQPTSGARPPLLPMPKSIHDPLPPRPPSQ
ncbi:MAG TPA: hypothetical protein VMT38_09815 [Terracidiphilus sp.]|nr:hypothetical protein [Terracidiphilus sp.]